MIKILIIVFMLSIGCLQTSESPEIFSRESKIPANATKITPETDIHPPQIFSDEYEDPVPLPYPVNTRGAEDSAFIMPDGKTLYLWFTPDANADIFIQAEDKVTGIYKFTKNNGQWSEEGRIWLNDPEKPTLDGCEFVQDNKMWFCSAREGYTGIHWFTAELVDGKGTNIQLADFDPELDVGELHITSDGNELYYHSAREGGKGEYDIWVSKKANGKWQLPENIEAVNSEFVDGWPHVTESGELFFSRLIGSPEIWRSKRVNGKWQEPELILRPLAGESSIDNDGNIYFTHHFYKDDKMIEADIYVAYKK